MEARPKAVRSPSDLRMPLGIIQLSVDKIVLDFGIHLFIKSYHVFETLPLEYVDGKVWVSNPFEELEDGSKQ